MSHNIYNGFLSVPMLSQDSEQAAMVKNIGGRISASVRHCPKEAGIQSILDGFRWALNLIEEDGAEILTNSSDLSISIALKQKPEETRNNI